jgi:hypothetical protein
VIDQRGFDVLAAQLDERTAGVGKFEIGEPTEPVAFLGFREDFIGGGENFLRHRVQFGH